MIFLKSALFLLIYSVSCAGIGAFLLRLKPWSTSKKIHRSAIRFLLLSYILGFSVVSFVLLLMAVFGVFYTWVILVVLAPGLLFFIFRGVKQLWQAAIEVSVYARSMGDLDIAWKIIAAACLIFYLLTFSTFGRPLSGDGAQLYMPWAKIISESHHLITVPDQSDYSVPGLFTEMHYAAFMSLDVREAGRLNDVILVTAIAAILVLTGRSLGIKKEGSWALLAFLFTSPVFIWLIGKGTSDLAPALLGLTAVFLLLPEERDFNTPLYALAGFFAGLSVYAKISYLIAFLPVLGLFIVFRYFSGNAVEWKKIWKSPAFKACLAFGIAAAIGFSPLIIKNTYIFGNPLNVPEGNLSNYSFDPETQFESLQNLLRSLPLSLFYGLNEWKSGRLSPLLLAFLPLCLFVGLFQKKFSENLVLQVTLAAITGFMLWVLLRPSSFLMRYFLATILLFSFLPAYCVEKFWLRTGSSAVKMAIALMIPVMLFSEFSVDIGTFFLPRQTAEYISGVTGECEKDGYHCIALKAINREAQPGDRVLFAEWFGYWMRPDLIQCMVTKADRQVYQVTPVSRSLPVDTFGLQQVPMFNDLWKEIHERGFKYLVRTKKPDANASKLDLTRMDETPWVHLVELYNNDYIEVYRIEYIDPPSEVKVTCTETSQGFWQLTETSAP